MKKILTLILLLASSFSVLAQESFSSVEERMTGKEFMQSGLGKLTDNELAALNKWLRDHSVATMENRSVTANRTTSVPAATTTSNVAVSQSEPQVQAVDTRGFEGKNLDRSTIVSVLIGEFKGWDGETVFKLQNGMIWKQSEKSRQITKLLIDPVVTIKAGMFNSWHLTVEGYNRNVTVKRIQ